MKYEIQAMEDKNGISASPRVSCYIRYKKPRTPERLDDSWIVEDKTELA